MERFVASKIYLGTFDPLLKAAVNLTNVEIDKWSNRWNETQIRAIWSESKGSTNKRSIPGCGEEK